MLQVVGQRHESRRSSPQSLGPSCVAQGQLRDKRGAGQPSGPSQGARPAARGLGVLPLTAAPTEPALWPRFCESAFLGPAWHPGGDAAAASPGPRRPPGLPGDPTSVPLWGTSGASDDSEGGSKNTRLGRTHRRGRLEQPRLPVCRRALLLALCQPWTAPPPGVRVFSIKARANGGSLSAREGPQHGHGAPRVHG